MLSEQVQYQGKVGFFKLNLQKSISQNTGKCKLGGFLLRVTNNSKPPSLRQQI